MGWPLLAREIAGVLEGCSSIKHEKQQAMRSCFIGANLVMATVIWKEVDRVCGKVYGI